MEHHRAIHKLFSQAYFHNHLSSSLFHQIKDGDGGESERQIKEKHSRSRNVSTPDEIIKRLLSGYYKEVGVLLVCQKDH